MKKTVQFLAVLLLLGVMDTAHAQITGIRVQQNNIVSKKITDSITPGSDTLTLFFYAYHKKKQKALLTQINDLENKADDIDNIEDVDELKTLQERIKNKQKYLDGYNIYFDKMMAQANDFNMFFPSFGKKKEDFFALVYSKSNENDLYFVNNAAVQLNNSGAAIQSELTAAFMGPLRLSFGTIVSNAKSDEDTPGDTEVEDTDAFKRLASGGGNMYLNAELPLFYKGNNRFQCVINGYAKGALDISEFSDDVDTSTGNGSFGGNFYGSIATDNGEFNFFISGNYALYLGINAFYDRLLVTDHRPFAFVQIGAGVTILDRLRISCIANQFGSESQLRSGKIIIGVQILSGLFKS